MPQPMDEDTFWALIRDQVDRDGTDIGVERLVETLSKRPLETITAYDQTFRKVYDAAYSWKLWGAAYLINGGCSDDGFDYFRGWLIGMGRDVYTAALKQPDSLATVAAEDVECEDMLYVANRAYEAASGGSELPFATTDQQDLGEDFDFDDNTEMRTRYPKLFARFASRG
jgi:hypothetical protein